MRRILKAFTWLLLVLIITLILYRRYAQHQSALVFNAFLANHRASIDQNLDRFASDRDSVLPQFQIKTRNHDAGARLNDWVTWTSPGASKSGLQGFIKAPTSLTNFQRKLAVWGNNWASQDDAKSALPDFDFSWMKELREFDHWRLDEAPPVKQALFEKPGILPLDVPTPDPASFSGWIELRLVQGIQQVQLADAIADTSQLATLLISSENLGMAEAGLRIFSRQLQAAEFYKKFVDPKFDDSRLPKAAAIESALWILGKEDLFFSVFTDRDVIADIFANGAPDALACAAINTHGPLVLRSKRVIGDLFGDTLKILTRVLHTEWKDCTLARLRPYWDLANGTTSDLAADPFVPPPLPEFAGFQFFYPALDLIAQFSRRDQGTLPPIMEYSSALRRAMGIAWAKQAEPQI